MAWSKLVLYACLCASGTCVLGISHIGLWMKAVSSKSFKNFSKQKQNKKRKAFREGDLIEVNLLKREIKNEIKRENLYYKEKLERELANNRLGSVWNGLKTIVGSEIKCNKKVALPGFNSDNQLAHEFNTFYLRFDCLDFSNEILNLSFLVILLLMFSLWPNLLNTLKLEKPQVLII